VAQNFLQQTTMATISHLRGSPFWIVTSAVIIICFLSGPFGTFEALPNGFRLVYWALIVLSTSILALWAQMLIKVRNWTAPIIIVLVSAVFGLFAALLVILLSLTLLPPIQSYPGHIALFGYSFPSAMIVFLFSALLSRADASAPKTSQRPSLFARLEKHPNAQQILSLSAQDHYVEVITELGSELCLIRLNDAIAETKPLEGFQIHRSHWVAKSAVEKLEVKGSSGQVRLHDGRALKVSQSRLTEFRAFLG